MNFPDGMRLELNRPNPSLRYGVQFTFPDTVKRYSDVALCSRNGGFHEPLVLDWGQISDAAGDRSNAMQVSDWSDLKIADPFGDWVTRGRLYELKGAPVVLTYGAKYYPGSNSEPDYFTRFQGILLDWKAADGVVTVQCGPSILLPLLAPFPEIRLTLADFPDLPDEFINIYAPVGPYGRHDSYGFGKALRGSSDGQVVPIYVGEYTEVNLEDVEITGSKYIFGVGQIKQVITVYRNGTPITQGFASGNYKDQAIFEVINGITWSRIMFTDDVSDDEITVDLEGYEDIGDGTGDVILNPADQLAHFITNFGLGRYKTGNWLPTDTSIDATYLAALIAYLGITSIPTGYAGGRYIEATDERSLVMDELDASCASGEFKGLFTLQGKLAFGADTFRNPGSVSALPWIIRQIHELTTGPMTPTFPSMDAAKRIMGETSHSHNQGSYTERLMVLSPTAQEEAADKVSRVWGPSVI